MMPNGQGNQLAHGHPGTPVGDLFPLGQALLGDANRSSLRPIRAGDPRSHSALFKILVVGMPNWTMGWMSQPQRFFCPLSAEGYEATTISSSQQDTDGLDKEEGQTFETPSIRSEELGPWPETGSQKSSLRALLLT